jgi:transposase-like protein
MISCNLNCGERAMKAAEFQGLIEQLDALTPEQRDAVAKALAGAGDGAETTALIEARFAEAATCPHCQGEAQKWGYAAGLRRYRCRSCKATFNAATGTPLANLKLRAKLAAYGQAMVEGLSLRKAAKRCGINLTTAFDWRHRLLKIPAAAKPKALKGVVEADETYVLESKKGSRKLTRKARKRGGKASKRGLSHEQIPVMVTRDRSGATLTEVMSEVTAASVTAILDPIVAKDAALVSDGAKAYRTFANATDRLHIALVTSAGEHTWGTYHIQNVNAYTSGLKAWMARFKGVATAYLPNYLGWHRKLEREGESFTRLACIAAALA